MKKLYLILTLLIVFISCNKDYKTVGLNLIDNNAFNTNLEEIPVYVKMRSIPPYVSNTLSTFQLGEYNDNIYGLSKVSFLSQINFEDPNLVFGDYKQSDEDNPEDNDGIVSIYSHTNGRVRKHLTTPDQRRWNLLVLVHKW